MSLESTSRRDSRGVKRFRSALAVVGLALWFVALVPPLAQWSRQYEYVQAIQFCVFAMLAPALLVTGAPWGRLGLASAEAHMVNADGVVVSPRHPKVIDRVVMSRRNQSGHVRAVTVGLVFVALVIFWRSAPVVDALVRDPWLVIVESLTLVGGGVVFWTELAESPPLSPGTSRPYRIGMSAVSMWVVWIVAYLNGLSYSSWYGAFHHVAGRGVSLSADQQFTSGVMWLLSASAFMPIVFWNLIHWLQSEEDPDEELHRIVRDDKILGKFDTNI